MLETIDQTITQWKIDANVPAWLADTRLIEALIVLGVILALHMIYKLARSTEVSETGKVSVKYHSPLSWLARYNEKIFASRARYTPKQKRFLSKMYRGRNKFEAFAAFLFGLLLTSIGAFLVYMEPRSIFEKITAGYLVAGAIVIAISWWLFSISGDDDPFDPDNNE